MPGTRDSQRHVAPISSGTGASSGCTVRPTIRVEAAITPQRAPPAGRSASSGTCRGRTGAERRAPDTIRTGRKSVGEGKREARGGEPGGRRIEKKKQKRKQHETV